MHCRQKFLYCQINILCRCLIKRFLFFSIGETEGKLLKEKENVVIQIKGSKTVKYEYNSITHSNTLKYKYTNTNAGTYKISATYN